MILPIDIIPSGWYIKTMKYQVRMMTNEGGYKYSGLFNSKEVAEAFADGVKDFYRQVTLLKVRGMFIKAFGASAYEA
jgi:hypothetical protein